MDLPQDLESYVAWYEARKSLTLQIGCGPDFYGFLQAEVDISLALSMIKGQIFRLGSPYSKLFSSSWVRAFSQG